MEICRPEGSPRRNVETASAGRQVFGAVAKADTDLSALIRRSLRAVGRTDDTEVTAFTAGCPGLRSILVDAGIMTPPIPSSRIRLSDAPISASQPLISI